jgi:RNA polymerase sigma-70 factor, ECF subfamily
MDQEATLIARIQAGDETALQELFELSKRQVYALAWHVLKNREDAEEVLQDTFVKLYQHNGFNPEYGSARAYLYAIARNEALMRLRAKGARPQLSDIDIHDPNAHFHAALQNPDDKLLVEKALASLEATDAKLLKASFYWGYTHDELSEQTGLPLGTVKSRVRRALLRLRDLLGDI